MNFILRDFDIEQDILQFHRVHSDPSSMLYYGMEPIVSIDGSRKLLNEYALATQRGNVYRKVIANATTSEYIGEIGLFNVNKQHHRANSYCILLPEYRKKGISKYVSKDFYNLIFSTTPINRIQAHADSRNKNATKSLCGIGYQYEGTLHQYEYDKGEFIDIDVYALLRKDYLEHEQNE